MRNDHIVLVGGAPLNEAFADAIGADAYCRDAAVAVETARALLARRQGSVQRTSASEAASTLARGRDGACGRGPDEPSGLRRRRRGAEARAQSARHRLRRAGARGPRAADARLAFDLTCLPASLHNRPEKIPEAMRARSAQPRPPMTRSSASTAIAARAARSTACSRKRASSASRARIATPSTPARRRSPRSPRRSRGPSTSPIFSPGISTRWSSRASASTASRASRRLFRQLPARRASGADRRSGDRPQGARPRRERSASPSSAA